MNESGLPDFSWHKVPKWRKIYRIITTLPNDLKIYQMTVKYSKRPKLLTFSIARPSKIYPNWDFWVENIPSGNPGMNGDWHQRQISFGLFHLSPHQASHFRIGKTKSKSNTANHDHKKHEFIFVQWIVRSLLFF
jgi:hypothetical protein